MSSLTVISCKHQNNHITFSQQGGKILVSWSWMDPWANRYVSVETDMEADLSIQVGKDGDITVAINTTRGYVNAVIGNPANNSGEWKSKTIYNLFMDWVWWVNEKFKLRLLEVLR